MIACLNGFLHIIELLLEHKNLNINLTDEVGNTGFMWAVIKGNLKVVKKLLLLKDLKLDCTDDQGRNAYDLSKQYKWKEISHLLKPYYDKLTRKTSVKNDAKKILD